VENLNDKIAIVTGANRGIGLEVVRQLAQLGLTVILGSRELRKGEQAAAPIIEKGLKVFPRRLDVTDQKSVDILKDQVEAEFGRLDILVNNAAILYDSWQRGVDADLDVVRQAFETNTLGPWRMCKAFIPLLRRSKSGRIVNVSSEAGSMASMRGGTPAYSVSKAALNALTLTLAGELRDTGILVNSVCPGWVATEMGGAGGRPIPDGAASVVWAAILANGGPTGGFYRDGKSLKW
jgi:NAD(P)-dependent dehydrogenase (short-subunit alcohol dehydrogenase family)